MPWIPSSVCHLSVNKTLSSILMARRTLQSIVWFAREFYVTCLLFSSALRIFNFGFFSAGSFLVLLSSMGKVFLCLHICSVLNIKIFRESVLIASRNEICFRKRTMNRFSEFTDLFTLTLSICQEVQNQ
jgi:hypothetical protein